MHAPDSLKMIPNYWSDSRLLALPLPVLPLKMGFGLNLSVEQADRCQESLYNSTPMTQLAFSLAILSRHAARQR